MYVLANFYLSSIQQGIQSAHVVHELFVKYKYNFDLSSRLYDWAENHKTMIVLNGGMNEGILAIAQLFVDEAKKLSFPAPFTSFNEDETSLGGIMTGVGIVLPEEIYDAVDYRKASPFVIVLGDSDNQDFYFIKDNECLHRYKVDSPEWKIISALKACPLAR